VEKDSCEGKGISLKQCESLSFSHVEKKNGIRRVGLLFVGK